MAEPAAEQQKIRYSSADLLRIRQLLRRREGEGHAKEILQATSPIVRRQSTHDTERSPPPLRSDASHDPRAVTPTRGLESDPRGGGPPGISSRQLNFLKGNEPAKGPGTPTHRRALSVPVDLGAVDGLATSENRWVPRRGQQTEDDRVFKLVKGILNKLTPEKFDTLIGQLMAIEVDSVSRLKGIAEIVFDKGVMEPSFSTMYSDLCVRLSGHLPEFPDEAASASAAPGEAGAPPPPCTFKRFLLSRCQEEFEKEPKFEEYEGLPAEERLEKEGKLKRRINGNVRFIGELFKKKMLGSWVIHECIARRLHLRPLPAALAERDAAGEAARPGQLLPLEADGSSPAEHELEAINSLLGTVGKLLDAGGPPHRSRLDAYFARIKSLAGDESYASRIRFMLQDLVELRRSAWVPRREEAVAKKIDQIRADLEHEQAQRGMGPRKHSGHARSGSGDWRALAELGRPTWGGSSGPGGPARASPHANHAPLAHAHAPPGPSPSSSAPAPQPPPPPPPPRPARGRWRTPPPRPCPWRRSRPPPPTRSCLPRRPRPLRLRPDLPIIPGSAAAAAAAAAPGAPISPTAAAKAAAPAPMPLPAAAVLAASEARPGHRRAISMGTAAFSMSAIAAAAVNTSVSERALGPHPHAAAAAAAAGRGCPLGTVAESPEKRGLPAPLEGTPPRVSQARFEQLGNGLLEEYWASSNVEEAAAAARELPDLRHYGPHLVSAAVTQALDRREKERLAVVPLLCGLAKAGVLPPALVERGLDELYEIAGELEVDFPRASLFMAALLAKLLAAGAVAAPYLARALTLAAPSKKAPRMFALCAKMLAKELGGKEAARDLYLRSGLVLANLFEPEERTPALVQAFLDDENLAYLR
eukprot:tig00000076_g2441.t1